MKPNPIILIDQVTKIYPRKPQYMKLREDTFFKYLSKRLFGGQSWGEEEYHALNDVSFKVYPGESVAVIGSNGAGKSTLLRVITGITSPTTGSVTIHGQHGELFALNSGFNAQLSGRKNIYLLAAIKGIPKERVEEQIDEIIEFSELGDFIDQPVKVYSSGMRGRLGFSILIHLLPDIIFIDEALATGDHRFRIKCIDRLHEWTSQNKTLLIVSHASNLLKEICTRAIWLDKGKIVMDGDAAEVIEAYENFVQHKVEQK